MDSTIIDTKEWTGISMIKDGFYFLCKPVSKRQPEHTCNDHVLNDGDLWWATDGHRLHCLDLDGFGAPGVYKVIKNTKSQTILQKADKPLREYPNVNMVWPEHHNFSKLFHYCPDDQSHVSGTFAGIVRAMPEDQILNYDYVSDVLCDDFTCYIYNEPNLPVAFENSNKIGLDYAYKYLTQPLQGAD